MKKKSPSTQIRPSSAMSSTTGGAEPQSKEQPHAPSTALAADLAPELRLDIRQSNVIRPRVPADRFPMAALVVGTVDQQATNARRPHFTEGYFLFTPHSSRAVCKCGAIARMQRSFKGSKRQMNHISIGRPYQRIIRPRCRQASGSLLFSAACSLPMSFRYRERSGVLRRFWQGSGKGRSPKNIRASAARAGLC